MTHNSVNKRKIKPGAMVSGEGLNIMGKMSEKKDDAVMVTITEEEYDKLSEDSQFLAALQSAGVDNWSGYNEAQELVEEWNNEE